MRAFGLSSLCALLASAGVCLAAPADGNRRYMVKRGATEYKVLEHRATGAKLEIVEDSGVCETTPGVKQYSGYLSVGSDMNMWFWFFEARNSPEAAPVAAWFNGGPGCSSMIGLFQENGPCQFYNGSNEPSLNPYSWNEYANMLYVDQPIDVGFSYGAGGTGTSEGAAALVWKFFQAFYDEYPKYENRDFAIFTESYGGHYGSVFGDYIVQQNKGVKNGSIQGQEINFVALGINNGWFNSYYNYPAEIEFAYNNTHRPLTSKSRRDSLMSTYETRCVPLLDTCARTSTNADCSRANAACGFAVENGVISSADFNAYDVREPADDPNPPQTYINWLSSDAIKAKIGARSDYTECSNSVGNAFARSGDESRSKIPNVSRVVQSGVQTLIWAGDADWICNWYANLDAANAVDYPGKEAFNAKTMEPFEVDGQKKGEFKSVDNLTFLRVYDGGHEVMFYQPEASLQAFKQIMQGKGLSST